MGRPQIYGTDEERRLANQIYQKKSQQKARAKLVILLGGRCVICGFSDERALQIDHKNGGGYKERKHHGNWVLYNFYLKHPEKAEEQLQILCANCNWIKRHERKEVACRG